MDLFKKKDNKVPFISPAIGSHEFRNIKKSLESTWLVYGEFAKQLEETLREKLEVEDVLLTGSCTSALLLSLKLANIGPGDEVITTPISWVATSNVIIECGATPIFCDVNPITGLLNEDIIESHITSRTKAIMTVDLYGQMSNMQKLREICNKYGLILIEDSAHSLEAEREGFKPGQLSDFAALSFHAAKNYTSGQGGALIVQNKEHGNLGRIMRRDGVVNLPNGTRRMVEFGGKHDGTDFQAAMILPQLKNSESILAKRQEVFTNYIDATRKLGIESPQIVKESKSAFHLFVVWLDPLIRDRVRELMFQDGISTSIHYDPIHLEPYYKRKFGFELGAFPASEKIGFGTVSLPTYPQLNYKKQKLVINSMERAITKANLEIKDKNAN